MKPSNRYLVLAALLIGAISASAQTAVPARPVDPSQAIPAQPVVLPPAVPAAPAAPGTTPAPASTNATTTPAAPVAVAIIADSSLKLVIQELTQNWADTLDTNPQVPITLTNAGTLRAKVTDGSQWDVVITADIQDAKDLTDKGLLLAEGQRSLARNTLVVYGRKALVKDDELDWFDLMGTEWKRVAMGTPDLLVSGRVAQRALKKHGLMDDDHKDLYTYAATDTLLLGLIESDQADAAFVYKSDLGRLSVPGFAALPISTEDAPPIFYTAAVSRLAKNPEQAHAFINYCGSAAAKPVWAKYGFETN